MNCDNDISGSEIVIVWKAVYGNELKSIGWVKIISIISTFESGMAIVNIAVAQLVAQSKQVREVAYPK